MFSFVIALVIGFLSIVVAVQNTGLVTIKFLFWTVEGPLVMVIFFAFASGALIALLLSFSKIIRLKWRLRDLLKASRLNKKILDASKAAEPKNK